MGDILVWLGVGGFFAAIMAVLAWLGSRVRRRGGRGGEGFMSPFEEIWHPAAHRARFEVQVVEERLVPMPSPDDQRGPLPRAKAIRTTAPGDGSPDGSSG